MNGVAYQSRRSVEMLAAARQPSVQVTGRCSWLATASSAPMARRSCTPRTGSRSRNVFNDRTVATPPRIMSAALQPSRVASKPETVGPIIAPMPVQRPRNATTRARRPAGYQSLSSGTPTTVWPIEPPIPPMRASPSLRRRWAPARSGKWRRATSGLRSAASTPASRGRR